MTNISDNPPRNNGATHRPADRDEVTQPKPHVIGDDSRSSDKQDRGAIYLEQLRQIAVENHGRLLSTEWKGATAKYRFAFADGREFEIVKGALVTRGWPKNADLYFRKFGSDRQAVQLGELRQIAEAHVGKLLSTEWKGSQVKYLFALADGRKFWKSAANLKDPERGGWPKDTDRYLKSNKMNGSKA